MHQGRRLLHPVEQHPLPRVGRHDPHAVRLDRLDRRLGELVHPAEPLERDQRLDRDPRAVTVPDRVDVRLALRDRAELVERRDHGLARLGDGQPGEALPRRLGHAPVLADHRDLLEAVAAPDLEVVRVVAGSDLERARAELGVDVVVRDDREPASDEGQDRGLADQVEVARVARVHGDRDVGEDRLGPHRRDRHVAARRDSSE